MAKYSTIIEHDRIIASERMVPIGARPQIDPNLENPEKIISDAPTFPIEGPISGWIIEDVSTFSSNELLNVSNEDSTPLYMQFNDDGSKLFVLGNSTSSILEYDLATPYSIEGAVYLESHSVDAYTSCFFIDVTGQYLFLGRSKSDIGSIYKYELSSAWDISSKNLVDRFSVRGSHIGLSGLFFSENGYRMYISSGKLIEHYYLDFPFNLETTHLIDNLTISEAINPISGFIFCPDGSKLYVCEGLTSKIFQYDIGTPFYLDSAVYEDITLDIQEDTVIYGIHAIDNNHLYVIGQNEDTIFQYQAILAFYGNNLVTGTHKTLDISDKIPSTGSSCMMSSDGMHFYATGLGVDNLFQWDLSTAWDINTATFVGSCGTVIFDNGYCWGLWITTDGSRAYSNLSSGAGSIVLVQYVFGTPFDVTTMTKEKNVTISTPGLNNWSEFQLSADGSRSWHGNRTDTEYIYQYDLSTPFDFATATISYEMDLTTTPFNSGTSGGRFYISEDGTRIALDISNNSNLYIYTLNTPWDLSDGFESTPDAIYNAFNWLNYRIYESVRSVFRLTTGTTVYDSVIMPIMEDKGYFRGSSGAYLHLQSMPLATNATIEFDIGCVSNDNGFLLGKSDSSSVYLGQYQLNSTSSVINNGVGSPNIYLDDVNVDSYTRGEFFDALCDGMEHHIKITNFDLASFSSNNTAAFLRTSNDYVVYSNITNITIDYTGSGTISHRYAGDTISGYNDLISDKDMFIKFVDFYTENTVSQGDYTLLTNQIDLSLDLVPTGTMDFEIKFRVVGPGDGSVFQTAGTSNTPSRAYFYSYDDTLDKYGSAWGNDGTQYFSTGNDSQFHIISKEGGSISLDGGESFAVNQTFSPAITGNLYLASVSGASSRADVEVEYLKIWSDSSRTTLVLDGWCVPAGFTATGATTRAGFTSLWDNVSQTYLTNGSQTTTKFLGFR